MTRPALTSETSAGERRLLRPVTGGGVGLGHGGMGAGWSEAAGRGGAGQAGEGGGAWLVFRSDPQTLIWGGGACHVSALAPARGITNTVMSSPDPSRSLGRRHPRSFRTPRDLMSRSWAARVYLWGRRQQKHRCKSKSESGHFCQFSPFCRTNQHISRFRIYCHNF